MQGRHILEMLSSERSRCRVQLVTRDGTQETSFGELWSLSSRVACAIKASVPLGRVAGLLTPTPEMIACFVGCQRAGRDFVSLPLPARGQDASQYSQQLRTIVELSDVTALVVAAAYEPILLGLPSPLPCPVLVAERLAESTTDTLRTEAPPGDIIQFSSGTTGKPKGVRLTGMAVGASVEATLDALGVGDEPETFCAWLPLSHDMGLIGGLLGSWVGSARTRPGYRYVCISPELFLMRPLLWMQTCAAVEATVTAAPTFAYHLLSRQLPRSPTLDLSSLRACIVGAEPIHADTLRSFLTASSAHGLRENALCPAYGLAEATLAVSLVSPGVPWTTRRVSVEGKTSEYVSCGRVLGCVNVDAPQSPEEAGAIRVSGPAVFSGYVPARDDHGNGSIETGDLGVMADGELVVTGRSDDLLCVSGRNMFAWELERAAASVSDVRPGSCAVVTNGRGGYVALFESRSESQEDIATAAYQVRKELAAIAGIGPSAVSGLRRGILPKTSSGKLQRNHITSNLEQLIQESVLHKEF